MHTDYIDNLLTEHQLRKTATRVDLLQVLLQAGRAMSSQDIEMQLPDADRITLYRTLKTFEDKGLIHQAIDGTQRIKYALCSSDCDEHSHHDSHAHFHCESCGKTTCVDEVTIAPDTLPAGLRISETSIVLKGTCVDCQ